MRFLILAVCVLWSFAAWAQAPLESWKDTPAKKAILAFVARATTKEIAWLCRAGGADCRIRQRWHVVVRAAHVCAARLRSRPREGARRAASRVEGEAAVHRGA